MMKQRLALGARRTYIWQYCCRGAQLLSVLLSRQQSRKRAGTCLIRVINLQHPAARRSQLSEIRVGQSEDTLGCAGSEQHLHVVELSCSSVCRCCLSRGLGIERIKVWLKSSPKVGVVSEKKQQQVGRFFDDLALRQVCFCQIACIS